MAWRCNTIVNCFAQRLLTAGLPSKAVISTVMYKLAHLIYEVIHVGKPFDANYCRKGLLFATVSDPGCFLREGAEAQDRLAELLCAGDIRQPHVTVALQ